MSQAAADEGQEAVEREWTVAACAWNRFNQERAAVAREFHWRRTECGEDGLLLDLEMSVALAQLVKPSMPHPGPHPHVIRRDAMAGYGYRASGRSDG